jgi:hypothetical protein
MAVYQVFIISHLLEEVLAEAGIFIRRADQAVGAVAVL